MINKLCKLGLKLSFIKKENQITVKYLENYFTVLRLTKSTQQAQINIKKSQLKFRNKKIKAARSIYEKLDQIIEQIKFKHTTLEMKKTLIENGMQVWNEYLENPNAVLDKMELMTAITSSIEDKLANKLNVVLSLKK